MELLVLCGFAFLAGLVDSVAGGGGLIQIPALFLFLPPACSASVATVLGTNKLSSICGTAVALAQYARRVPIRWPSILPAGATAFGFSFLGARVVSVLQPEVLRPLILLLLIVVAVYTYAHKELGQGQGARFTARRERFLGLLVGAGIGFYDGFFGPGTGSFLIFIFVGWFGFDFLVASASAKVVNFATNLSAVAYFVATDHVLYGYGLPMAACNILGSLVGTRLAILKGNRFIRAFFLGVVGLLILRFAYDAIGRR